MQRDRDVLYNAVSYTKGQTAQLVDLIGGLHGHMRTVISGGVSSRAVSFDVGGEDAFPELHLIEQGLKNILHSVTKVGRGGRPMERKGGSSSGRGWWGGPGGVVR